MVYRLVISPTQIQNDRIILTPQQRHYLNRVLRLKDGDRLIVMDGQGKSWLAQLNGTSAQILETLIETTELSITITLIVALPKGNGFDQVVRCCTELGVTTLMPVISDRTLLKPSPHKLERWRKIAQEAAEQSERQIVPHILEPAQFSTVISLMSNTDSDCYICVARREVNHLMGYLQQRTPSNIAIATGPEGGWTSAEIEQALKAGFQPISLGRRILRAITAPIVALSLVAATVESKNL